MNPPSWVGESSVLAVTPLALSALVAVLSVLVAVAGCGRMRSAGRFWIGMAGNVCTAGPGTSSRSITSCRSLVAALARWTTLRCCVVRATAPREPPSARTRCDPRPCCGFRGSLPFLGGQAGVNRGTFAQALHQVSSGAQMRPQPAGRWVQPSALRMAWPMVVSG